MPNGENFASSIIVERRVDDEYFELEVGIRDGQWLAFGYTFVHCRA